MQTFLPFRDFDSCARHLDYRRLGKQRVEAFQLLCGLRDPWALEERERRLTEQGKAVKPIQNGWTNHPASKMWRGHTEMLGNYMNTMISEWVARGYNNTMNHRPSSDCPTSGLDAGRDRDGLSHSHTPFESYSQTPRALWPYVA